MDRRELLKTIAAGAACGAAGLSGSDAQASADLLTGERPLLIKVRFNRRLEPHQFQQVEAWIRKRIAGTELEGVAVVVTDDSMDVEIACDPRGRQCDND